MASRSFSDWAERHGNTFGINQTRQDFAMLTAWQRVFEIAGYTLAELDAATDAMALAPPRTRWDHLDSIHANVRLQRRRRLADAEQKRRDEYGESVGQCVLCFDCGTLSVPHPRHIENGRWDFCTFVSVVCFCWRGRQITQLQTDRFNSAQADRKDKPGDRPALTLQQYERVNPAWKAQMEQHVELKKAEVEAQRRSITADSARPLTGPVNDAIANIRTKAGSSKP